MQRLVAVIGPGHASRREYNLAADVGRLLAQRGIGVVCGGLFGVMEAACQGAKEAGGTTIGILRTYTRQEANAYVDYVIPSGLGDARNVLVATAGEAVIAVGGRLGTLSEIAIALKHGIPVVGLGTWKLDPDSLFDKEVPQARTAEEAVEIAVRLADEREAERAAGAVPRSEAEDDSDASADDA
jgi:uncharacterized protein (TIGR00725 family)